MPHPTPRTLDPRKRYGSVEWCRIFLAANPKLRPIGVLEPGRQLVVRWEGGPPALQRACIVAGGSAEHPTLIALSDDQRSRLRALRTKPRAET